MREGGKWKESGALKPGNTKETTVQRSARENKKMLMNGGVSKLTETKKRLLEKEQKAQYETWIREERMNVKVIRKK